MYIYQRVRSLCHQIIFDYVQVHYQCECSRDLLLHQILGWSISLIVPSQFRMYLWAIQMIKFGPFHHRLVLLLPFRFHGSAYIHYHIHFRNVNLIFFYKTPQNQQNLLPFRFHRFAYIRYHIHFRNVSLIFFYKTPQNQQNLLPFRFHHFAYIHDHFHFRNVRFILF